MKSLKNILFVLVFLALGMSGVVIAESLFTIGGETEGQQVLEISEVSLAEQDYYVNQPLNLEGAKLNLLLEDGTTKTVDLHASNITNFSTRTAGDFEMTIVYGAYTYKYPYTVRYKSIQMEESDFEFELDENLEKSSYYLNCLDFYDLPVEKVSLTNAEIFNFDTSQISSGATAIVRFQNLTTTFDYSVFYFSGASNYVGSSEVLDDCVYEIVQFKPGLEAKLSIAKRIVSLNVVEKIYEFDLKRLDLQGYSKFLDASEIVKLDYDKNLTIMKGVAGNSEEVVIKVSRGDEIQISEPCIKEISQVTGFEENFMLNQQIDLSEAKAVLLLSDNTNLEVDLSETNFSNLKTDEVGKFSATINFYSFAFEKSYNVNYKSLEFYPPIAKTGTLEFEVGSSEIFDLSIVCFDFNDNPVAVKSLSDKDVELVGFSSAEKTEEKKLAKIICFGAVLEFEYIVV